jgi:protein O-GlcNAc transferase
MSVLASVKETLHEGLAHHKDNRLDLAARSYRRVLETEPENPDALHLLGMVVLAQGDPEAAIELIDTAAAIAPNRATILFHLGEARRAAGRLTDSLAAFEATLEIEPSDTAALFHVGSLLVALDRPDDAVPVFLKATALSPRSPELKLALAVALKDSGDLAEAGRLYHGVVDAVPNLADAHAALGIVLPEQHRMEDALDTYRSVLISRPEDFREALQNIPASSAGKP